MKIVVGKLSNRLVVQAHSGIILKQYRFFNFFYWGKIMTTSLIKMPKDIVFRTGKMYIYENKSKEFVRIVLLCTNPLEGSECFTGVIVHSLGAPGVIGDQSNYLKSHFCEFRGEVTLSNS